MDHHHPTGTQSRLSVRLWPPGRMSWPPYGHPDSGDIPASNVPKSNHKGLGHFVTFCALPPPGIVNPSLRRPWLGR